MNNTTTLNWEEKLTELKNPKTTEEFQKLCNSFEAKQWFSFLEDLFNHPSKIYTNLGIPRDTYYGYEDPVIDIVVDFANLGESAQKKLINTIENKYLSQEQIENLDGQDEKIHKLFYIIGATPLNIRSRVLEEIVENYNLSENIRYKAALRLCNSTDETSNKKLWQEVMENKLNPRPKFLPVVIKALTNINHLNTALKLIKDGGLEKIPDEYYLSYEAAFREFLRKEYPRNGETKQHLYIQDYPEWSHECIEWTIKEDEFEYIVLRNKPKLTIEELDARVRKEEERADFREETHQRILIPA